MDLQTVKRETSQRFYAPNTYDVNPHWFIGKITTNNKHTVVKSTATLKSLAILVV